MKVEDFLNHKLDMLWHKPGPGYTPGPAYRPGVWLTCTDRSRGLLSKVLWYVHGCQ